MDLPNFFQDQTNIPAACMALIAGFVIIAMSIYLLNEKED